MGASPETIACLRRMLLEAPDSVRAFLAPQVEAGRLVFTLTETILVGGKA